MPLERLTIATFLIITRGNGYFRYSVGFDDVFLPRTAERADEIVGKFVETGAGLDALFRCAEILVVFPTAKLANVFHVQVLLLLKKVSEMARSGIFPRKKRRTPKRIAVRIAQRGAAVKSFFDLFQKVKKTAENGRRAERKIYAVFTE